MFLWTSSERRWHKQKHLALGQKKNNVCVSYNPTNPDFNPWLNIFFHQKKTRQRKAWHPLAGGQSWPWPMNPWPKINRGPLLIIHNLHVKFESDWAKTVVAIVSTRSYTQSATVDLDLWPRDPKSIGFLLSSSTTYMWSLKVIGQKL